MNDKIERLSYRSYMDTEVSLPVPRVLTPDGRPEYFPPEVAAYRKARGVTQPQLAASMKVDQPRIAAMERISGSAVKRPTVPDMLYAIDRIARRRDRLVAEGLAELEAIRAGEPVRSVVPALEDAAPCSGKWSRCGGVNPRTSATWRICRECSTARGREFERRAAR